MFSYIECIEKKYGKETLNKEAATIQKKCNQKCLDTKAKNDVCTMESVLMVTS